MPVTAKLSRKFYETFGQDVTNELVDWFNSVDATYRGNLRELNESNFSRFDANIAEMNGKWEGRFAAFDAKLEQRLAELKGELQTQIAQGLAAVETRLVRWMVGLWVTSLLTMVALTLRA